MQSGWAIQGLDHSACQLVYGGSSADSDTHTTKNGRKGIDRVTFKRFFYKTTREAAAPQNNKADNVCLLNMNSETPTVVEKLDEGETAQNSVLEKTPTPAASVHSNREEEAPQQNDDEIQYPGMMTKVAVGIGLALAVFLVRILSYRLGFTR